MVEVGNKNTKLKIKELEDSYIDAKNHHEEAAIAIPKIVEYMVKRGLASNIKDIDNEYNEKKKILKERKKKVKKKKEEIYRIETGKFSIGNGLYKESDYTKELKEVKIAEITIETEGKNNEDDENKENENDIYKKNDIYLEIANNKLQIIKKNSLNGFIKYLVSMKNCILEKLNVV